MLTDQTLEVLIQKGIVIQYFIELYNYYGPLSVGLLTKMLAKKINKVV